MTRPLRLSFENAFYHITARGNRREDIFYSSRDKEVFLKRLKEMLIKYSMICYAYCLMDNHYHLFIKTTQSCLKVSTISTVLMPIGFVINIKSSVLFFKAGSNLFWWMPTIMRLLSQLISISIPYVPE